MPWKIVLETEGIVLKALYKLDIILYYFWGHFEIAVRYENRRPFYPERQMDHDYDAILFIILRQRGRSTG